MRRTLGIIAIAALIGATVLSGVTPKAKAVSLSPDQIINYDNLDYDGLDIVIPAGVTATINGLHTFKSLKIEAGGTLTHSNYDSTGRLNGTTEVDNTSARFTGQIAISGKTTSVNGRLSLCPNADDRDQVIFTKRSGNGPQTFTITNTNNCSPNLAGQISQSQSSPTIYDFTAYYKEDLGKANFLLYGDVDIGMGTGLSTMTIQHRGLITGTYYQNATNPNVPFDLATGQVYGGTQYWGPITGEKWGAGNITLSASGSFAHDYGIFFTRDWGWGIVGPVSDISIKPRIIATESIEIYGIVDVTGKGYRWMTPCPSDDSGAGPGGGYAGADSAEGGGGSYGGVGGVDNGLHGADQPRAPTYGSETDPNDFGSSGGCQAGEGPGAGGGIIYLQAPKIVINGTLVANGQNGAPITGAGAGGSININADVLEIGENASIMANGGSATGDGGDVEAGTGGGGRVAVKYKSGISDSSVIGNVIHVEGGDNPQANDPTFYGSEGTVYINQQVIGAETISITKTTGPTSINSGGKLTVKLEIRSAIYQIGVRITDYPFKNGATAFAWNADQTSFNLPDCSYVSPEESPSANSPAPDPLTWTIDIVSGSPTVICYNLTAP